MRELVVVAEGLGLTEAHTSGGFAALERGLATSARLVVPGPWAPEVVRRYRGQDLGVSLSLTSPHPLLRLCPLTGAPTLRSGDGGLPTTAADLIEHADPEEASRELRTQLERAILWGIGVTHLAIADDLLARADLFDAVAELAEEYHLPVRLTPSASEERLGYDAWGLAVQRGIATISGVVPIEPGGIAEGRELLDVLLALVHALPQGTSELALPFATQTPELGAWLEGGGPHAVPSTVVGIAERLWNAVRSRGVEPVGYRELSRRSGQSRSDGQAPARAPDTRATR